MRAFCNIHGRHNRMQFEFAWMKVYQWRLMIGNMIPKLELGGVKS